IASAAPALEEHRQGLVEELWASPYLTRFPASLDPSPFPTTVRFREPPQPPSSDAPLPDWWGGSTAPLLYMTFGTVLGHMSVAAGVYRTALKAVESLDVRALLTVGRQFDRADLGPVPAHVHVERWVDQADVFPRADLVVCHGGSGTAFGAAAAGVPVVVVPVFADQFVNGLRIAGTGAGLVVEADPRTTGGPRRVIAEVDAPRLTAGIETVLGDPSYRRQARVVAAEVATATTVDAVLDTLLRAEPSGAIP
ncbi:MAG TPA: nucleotide disphospho-sugar-binding domain-containing protein, partial [Acidimicrobiales bacterium]|nr:nucleotide disphospho-sugar-binding domain-containing protein [Acidimicrobiales bacterium]